VVFVVLVFLAGFGWIRLDSAGFSSKVIASGMGHTTTSWAGFAVPVMLPDFLRQLADFAVLGQVYNFKGLTWSD
jgi:hypothetical protein